MLELETLHPFLHQFRIICYGLAIPGLSLAVIALVQIGHSLHSCTATLTKLAWLLGALVPLFFLQLTGLASGVALHVPDAYEVAYTLALTIVAVTTLVFDIDVLLIYYRTTRGERIHNET